MARVKSYIIFDQELNRISHRAVATTVAGAALATALFAIIYISIKSMFLKPIILPLGLSTFTIIATGLSHNVIYDLTRDQMIWSLPSGGAWVKLMPGPT